MCGAIRTNGSGFTGAGRRDQRASRIYTNEHRRDQKAIFHIPLDVFHVPSQWDDLFAVILGNHNAVTITRLVTVITAFPYKVNESPPPDLLAAGAATNHPAVDGRPLSGLAQDNNDALSRRDMGLEFLDVTGQVNVALMSSSRVADDNGDHGRVQGARDSEGHRGSGGEDRFVYRITNNGASPVDTHLLVIATGLTSGVEMTNASGTT